MSDPDKYNPWFIYKRMSIKQRILLVLFSASCFIVFYNFGRRLPPLVCIPLFIASLLGFFVVVYSAVDVIIILFKALATILNKLEPSLDRQYAELFALLMKSENAGHNAHDMEQKKKVAAAYFRKKFGEEVSKNMMYHLESNSKTSKLNLDFLEVVSKKPSAEKLALAEALFEFAQACEGINNAENELLKQIIINIKLPQVFLEYLTGKYFYRNNNDSQNFQQQKSEKGQQQNSSRKQEDNYSQLSNAVANAYRVLGLPTTSTQKEVHDKYKSLVKEYHPDLIQDEALKKSSADKLKEINAAYDLLSERR